MKKFIILSLCALLTIISCSKITVPETTIVTSSIEFVRPVSESTKATVDTWDNYEQMYNVMNNAVQDIYTKVYKNSYIINNDHYTPVFTLKEGVSINDWSGSLSFDLPDVGESVTFNPTMSLVNVKTDGSQPDFKSASGSFTITNNGGKFEVTNTKTLTDKNAIVVEIINQDDTEKGFIVNLKIKVTMELDSWLLIGRKFNNTLEWLDIYSFSTLKTGNKGSEVEFPITIPNFFGYWGKLDGNDTFRITGSKVILNYHWLVTEGIADKTYILERGKWYGIIPSQEGREGSDDKGTVGGSSDMWDITADGIASGGKIG